MDEDEKIRSEIKEALRKQLRLLSGRSDSPCVNGEELPALTHAMIEVAAVLQTNFL